MNDDNGSGGLWWDVELQIPVRFRVYADTAESAARAGLEDWAGMRRAAQQAVAELGVSHVSIGFPSQPEVRQVVGDAGPEQRLENTAREANAEREQAKWQF